LASGAGVLLANEYWPDRLGPTRFLFGLPVRILAASNLLRTASKNCLRLMIIGAEH
jgi:hypothetical protein